jgi:hypothetical protein
MDRLAQRDDDVYTWPQEVAAALEIDFPKALAALEGFVEAGKLDPVYRIVANGVTVRVSRDRGELVALLRAPKDLLRQARRDPEETIEIEAEYRVRPEWREVVRRTIAGREHAP